MEVIHDESSFSRNSREQDEGRYHSGNLILWIAAIAVLIGLNFGSWSFCMWVFGQPEHPMNYKLLTRLDKLDPIVGFTPVNAPRGKFRTAKDLYGQIYNFDQEELRAYNGILKRLYLKNFAERDDVTYLAGEWTVDSWRKMEVGDVFDNGVVIRAKSTSFPDAVLDLALPSPEVPGDFELERGQVIKLEESSTCAAVLNIERRKDDTMIFTAVPLVARDYRFTDDGSAVSLVPQERVRIDPELWPISAEVEVIEKKPVELSDQPIESSSEEPGEEEKSSEEN